MLNPKQIETKLDHILLKVQKPGRYVGGELNITLKDWDRIQTKVAFVFPDIYDIGVSNVGLKILYDQVNQRDDALAERAYAPWVDMEAKWDSTIRARIETAPGLLRHHRLFPALRDTLHQHAQHPRFGWHPGQVCGA